MDALLIAVVTLVAGTIGGILLISYQARVSRRQERAILIQFVQEYLLLYSRCSMYYEQMLKGKISFSTLFEISDATTFTKFSELIKNAKVQETAMRLKADFFQVIRYADIASTALGIERDRLKATRAQGLAVTFFMGEAVVEGAFARHRYREYAKNIRIVLDYIETLISRDILSQCLKLLSPNWRWGREMERLESHLEETRNTLNFLENDKLYCLRLREELIYLKSLPKPRKLILWYPLGP
jgi:hypothetical protein